MSFSIGIGSSNQTKVDAIAEILVDYPMFKSGKCVPMSINIEEFGHPKNIDETVEGAVQRAKQAFPGNKYGFGIESGLIHIPQTQTGVMEVAVCAIWDGEKIYMGLSPAFEWPTKVLEGIRDGLDGSQAMKNAGLTVEDKIGAKGGVASILSKGRIDRKEVNKSSVVMALMQLENKELYF